MSDHDEKRAGFAERVARLAGETTYREPIGGYGTRGDYMPDAHAIAAAMAFARLGRHDIGPDIAVAIATGCTDHRMTIVRELAAALLATTGRVGQRCSAHLLQLSAHSYLCVIGAVVPEPIKRITKFDYANLREVGDGMLWQAAEDAFARARKTYCATA